MSLRSRFALLFSFLVFIILMVCVSSIYFLYEDFRKNDFYGRVQEKAILFSASFPSQSYDSLISPAPTLPFNLPNEIVAFYDNSGRMLYASQDVGSLNISYKVLGQAKRKRFHFFSHGFRESVAYHIDNKYGRGYIVASAYDMFGRRKINNLKLIMLATLGGGLLLSGLFAFFYAKKIVKPLTMLTNQMQRVTEGNVYDRIEVPNEKTELSRIARNFNDMLDRLENAFEMRKRFVQQASHELRTPLTSMLAQTEAALAKKLSHEESNAIFRSLREDQQHMIDLTNSLLLLSKYEKLTQITDLEVIRVDELLYDVIDSIKMMYPQTRLSVNYASVPDDEGMLTIMGNEILLMSAIQNLVKNACHYAEDDEVIVLIDASSTEMRISFDNNGKQLTNDEMERLFIPFFRGENSMHKKGYGLGLSIVQRIITLHKGTVTYTAVNDKTNRFSITLPTGEA